MLDELSVRNLALLEEAHLLPGRGLVVVSGETGTGKTLLLGALRLLLGAEPRNDPVGPFADETMVEGRFIVGGEEVIVSRRIPREGRSRSYLNGSLASSQALGERLGPWVEIIGQHDQLSLTRRGAVRELVDGLLDAKGRATLDRYRKAWQAFTRIEAARARLGGDRRALARELDLVRFQVQEIDSGQFQLGEDEELQRRATRLRHAEALLLSLAEAAEAFSRAGESLTEAVVSLRKASRLDSGMTPLSEEAERNTEALVELARAVRLSSEGLRPDGQELAEVENRLNQLGELRRKYGSSLAEILAFAEEARRRSEELESLLTAAATIDADREVALLEVMGNAEEVTQARTRAGKKLADRARGHLRDLGLDDPVIAIEAATGPPEAGGADRLRLLFASDRRLPSGEITKVASGGELSRLILSLRLAALHPAVDGQSLVLAFDEIDAGVGGATAIQLGRKLGALARDHQVLCVTHLPQVAAFADTHYVVERTGNRAEVTLLDGERQIAELSRMLAGLPDSTRGQQAAQELVALANGGRNQVS